jgi:formylglycine-generating enzyme required for sulfatase activity
MCSKLFCILSTLLILSACGNDTDTTATDTATATALPSGIEMKSITGGTFTMGDNALLGPSAGKATEHSVTLSAFTMSETEVTNGQYVEFLNAAIADSLIEVAILTTGPSAGGNVIQGTSTSTYEGNLLYFLDGSGLVC